MNHHLYIYSITRIERTTTNIPVLILFIDVVVYFAPYELHLLLK